jgi:hypothetical protein
MKIILHFTFPLVVKLSIRYPLQQKDRFKFSNLDEITNDQVMVTVNAPSIKTDEITYHIPKTVPGTYSEDNYGRYIEDLKA